MDDIQLSTDGSSFTSVVPNGTMTLVVGNTYWIKLVGSTATNGYEQIETFINFPNTIFQILEVVTTYTAGTSPTDMLYGDACTWENDPDSPNYLSCTSTDKQGGDITVTYKVKILSVPSSPLTNPEALSSLVYDFSGSSFHYNSDYGVSTRYTYIIEPSDVTISKSFTPDTITPGGTSTMTIRITNPATSSITGVNFVDDLPDIAQGAPGDMVIAGTPNLTYSGCGSSPSPASLSGGEGSISFSNITLSPSSACTIRVNVTAPSLGTYTNTTNNLYINETTDTGNTATDYLTVAYTVVACTNGTMAQWTVPATATNPPDTTGGVATTRASNVSTATASAYIAGQTSIDTSSGQNDTYSWNTWGYKSNGQYVQFVVQTKNYSGVGMSFYVQNTSPSNGPTTMAIQYSTNGSSFTTLTNVATPATTTWTLFGPYDFSGLTSTTGNTYFRIVPTGAKNNNSGAGLKFDLITFTGCSYFPPPSLSKSFGTDPIKVNTDVSTLTFTVSNTATSPYDSQNLTGVTFSDTLPAGVVIADIPNASTTCASGSVSAPAGGSTISLTGASMAAGSTCYVYVDVKGTVVGTHDNVSGYIDSNESEPNKTSTGYSSDSLTVLGPPSIVKSFSDTTILTGNTTSLSFTITNPNLTTTLTGLQFNDNLRAGLTVATGSSTPCSGTLTTTSPTTISFSGGSLTADSSCTFSVTVTGSTSGSYLNTTGNVSSANGGTGNTASAYLEVRDANPYIDLLKQVGPADTGPWSSFLAVQTGDDVYYRFIVENTGDVVLNNVAVTDPNFDMSDCSWEDGDGNSLTAPFILPVADGDEGHIAYCVLGPVTAVSGSHTNTATADSDEFGPVEDSATYATVGLTIDKSVLEQYYIVAGDPLNYSYVVTNSGSASLAGPVTVSDNKVSVDCPAVNTVGDLDNFFDPGESIICGAQLTGTVEVTNGNATVTGTNTAFSTQLIAGDSLYIKSVHYTVLSITDDTHLTLSTDYTGTDASGVAIFTTATYFVTDADVTAGFVTNIASASTTLTGPFPAVTSNEDSETVNNSPTLVLLSSFMAYEDNGKVVVRWETSSELKTLGFLLLRLDENTGEYKRVNSGLLPAMMRPPQGGIYSLIDRGASPSGTYTYKFVEIERSGANLIYGPFTVFAGSPDDPHANALEDGSAGKGHVVSDSLEMLVKSSEKTTVMKNETDKGTTYVIRSVTNNPLLSLPSDFTRQLREQSGADKARLQSKELWYAAKVATSKSKTVKGDRVKLSIVDRGIYYISANDISSLTGIAPNKVTSSIGSGQLSLSTQGNQVAYLPAANNAGLYFYATEIDSIYTRKNVYWIDIGKGTLMTSVKGKAPSSTGSGSFVDSIHFEKDSFMDTYAVSDPDADYWFWADLYSPPFLPDFPDVREFTMHVDGVADTGTASIKANLYGAFPVEYTPHNHAQVFINDCLLPGTDPDSGIWSGMEPYTFEATFSQSCLLEGDNIVTVQNILDSGVDQSYFYVDSFDLTYTRLYEASNDELLFKGDGNTLVTVGGFTSSDIMVFDITDPLLPKLQKNVAVNTKSGTVSLVPAAPATPYYAVSDKGIRTAGLEAVPAPTLALSSNAANYIIIAPEEFVSTVQILADYRKGKGLQAKVVKLKDVMNEFNFGISSPEVIKSFLSYAYSNWTKKPRYVLLAGDGSIDYKDNMGYGSNLVPAKIVSTPYGPFVWTFRIRYISCGCQRRSHT